MQRYRPGMGLQNKNTKLDDSSLKTERIESDKIVTEADMVRKSEANASEEIHTSMNTSNKSSKNTRNRRPDIQVYMPKGKVAAQLTGKKPDNIKQSSPDVKHVSVQEVPHKARSNNSNANHTKGKNKLQKEAEKEYCNKNLSKCSNSSSPQPTGSWADLMDASDLSNAGSTPEQICNGHVSESQPPKSGSQKKENNPKTSTRASPVERHRKQRSRRNSLRNDHQQSNLNEDWHVKNSEVNHKMANGFENSSNSHTSADKRKTFNRNRHVSGNSDRRECNRSPVASKENCNNAHHQAHNAALDNKLVCERKKRDKMDQPLPPRFQKMKTMNKDNSTSQTGIGGILKMPIELEPSSMHSNAMEDNFCKPPVYPEPPTFIHKQLFDPNNPSKPEIINIPAPVPSPHIPFARMSPPYYAAPDSLNSSYISPPVANSSYIPPPQPAVNHQYNFLQPDLNIANVPSPYRNMRDGITTQMQCPIPASPLHAFPRPPVCYNDIPAVVNEPSKRR